MYSKAFLILSSVWAFGLAQTASAAEYPFLSTLSVNIQQIDSTSVNITFSNHDDKKISLFTQNTLFDDAAANSFIVTHKVDGKEIKLGGGEGHFRNYYLETSEDHVLDIPAHSVWTGIFDLTKVFDIPQDGIYKVSPKNLIPVVEDPTKSLKETWVSIKSVSQTMSLSASRPPPLSTLANREVEKRGSFNYAGGCGHTEQEVIDYLLPVAKTYAQTGYYSMTAVQSRVPLGQPVPIYDLYFGDHSAINSITNAFQRVWETDLSTLSNYKVFCYSNAYLKKTDSGNCKSGSGGFAYKVKDGPYTLTLCKPFFDKVPQSVNCDEKAPAAITNERPIDQPGILFHEMLHNYELVQRQISDGLPNEKPLYDYSAIVKAASRGKFDGYAGPYTANAYLYFVYSEDVKLRKLDHVPKSPGHGICISQPYKGGGGL